MSRPPGVTNLSELLGALDPYLDPEPYVFTLLKDASTAVDGAVAWFRESEGVTCVMREDDAARLDLDSYYPCRRIELRVQSSLEAVGLLASVCAALAHRGISVNAYSAMYHDHLFVPQRRVDDAMACLAALVAAQPRSG